MQQARSLIAADLSQAGAAARLMEEIESQRVTIDDPDQQCWRGQCSWAVRSNWIWSGIGEMLQVNDRRADGRG